MPERDLDGTEYKLSRSEYKGKSLTDVDEKTLRATYGELEKGTWNVSGFCFALLCFFLLGCFERMPEVAVSFGCALAEVLLLHDSGIL